MSLGTEWCEEDEEIGGGLQMKREGHFIDNDAFGGNAQFLPEATAQSPHSFRFRKKKSREFEFRDLPPKTPLHISIKTKRDTAKMSRPEDIL